MSFGNSVFAEVMKTKLYWFRSALNPTNWCPSKERKRHRGRQRRLCEDREAPHGAATSQGRPEGPGAGREVQGWVLPQSPEKKQACQHLGFGLLNWRRINSYCLRPPRLRDVASPWHTAPPCVPVSQPAAQPGMTLSLTLRFPGTQHGLLHLFS